MKRHCALCPACQSRRTQAEQLLIGLHEMASMPTPERVRAAVFAQLPAIEAHIEMHQDAAYHMQVSLGLDVAAKRRYAFRRLVWIGSITAAIGLSGLLIAPHVIPGFPDVRDLFTGAMWDMRDLVGDDRRALEQDAQHVAEVNQSLNSSEREAQFLAKAKVMRERWKPWAIAQKPLMRQMLKGDEQGVAALLHLYQDLPTGLPESGTELTYQDLNAGGLSFTWQPAAKLGMTSHYNPTSPRYQGKALPSEEQHSSVASPPVAVAYDAPPQAQPVKSPVSNRSKDEERIIKSLKADYSRCHDIQLSRSIYTGTTYCTLWASGRITETTQKLHRVGGRWESEPSRAREICPPYEELTR